MTKDRFKLLIAENKTDEVIEALRNVSNKIESKRISNAIILLSSRYEAYVDKNILGTAGQEEEDVSLAKLNQAILTLLDEIPEKYFNAHFAKEKEAKESTPFDQLISKVLKIAILVMFLLSMLGLISSMVFQFIVYWSNPVETAENFKLTNLIPFGLSLVGLATSGFFYFLNKTFN